MKLYTKGIALFLVLIMMASLAAGCMQATPISAEPQVVEKIVEKEVEKEVFKNQKRIKVTNAAGVDQPINHAIDDKMGPYVTEKTNGEFVVECYPAGQLADDQRGLEMCRAGTIEMVCTATAWVTPVVSDVAIFDIPFLFAKPEVADYVLDSGVTDMIKPAFEAQDLILLAFYEHGHRHLTNSKHEVSKVEDVAGLKIRVMDNPNHLALWKQLGANPIAMARTEVFSALQQKVIDAQENPIPDFFSSAIHEVAPYITITGHIYSSLAGVYSKKVFNSYSAEVQKIIQEGADEAKQYVRDLTRDTVVKQTKEMIDFGCTITELTADAHKGFADKTTELREQIAAKINPEFYKAFMAKADEGMAKVG